MRGFACFGFLLLIGLFLADEASYARQAQLPITETRALKALPEQEASSGIQVRLQGMVMYCANFEVTHCMLRDQTGAVLIKDPATPLEPGMIVDVHGRTIYENHTKVGAGAEVRIIRKVPLPEPMKTVAEVRSLSLDESNLAYPIHLQGIITYCSPATREDPFCFLQDDTGGIFFFYDGDLPEYGTEAEIRGVSSRGWFAPDIDRGASLKVKGQASLPAPSALPMIYLLKGKEDSKWVEIEGLIEAAYVTDVPEHVGLTLEVSTTDDKPLIIFINHDEVPQNLKAAVVRVQGVAAGFFNQNRQLIGVNVRVPSMGFIEIKKPGIEDPFTELPRRPLNKILAFSLNPEDGNIIHVGGAVTYIYPEGDFVIQDNHGAIRVNTEDSVSLGDTVQVAGYPKFGDRTPFIENASVNVLGKAIHLPKPATQRFDSLYFAETDGLLVK